MSRSIRKIATNLKGKFQFQILHKLVDLLNMAAQIKASRKIKNKKIGGILIDNTVLGHSITHETTWVSTGKKHWGNNEIDTGYAARIPVHSDHDDREAARSVRYLPGIANLAKRSLIALAVSKELQDEQWTQPVGRFAGYGIYDFSLFRDLKFETIEDPDYTMIIAPNLGAPSLKEQRRQRLESKTDPLYKSLITVLGKKNSQDVWHLVTAERNDCYCFLTMDFRLIRNIRAQARNKIVKSLKTKVMSPEEFGKEFSIVPIPPRLYSYHDASYPVMHETNWHNSKRQKHTVSSKKNT